MKSNPALDLPMGAGADTDAKLEAFRLANPGKKLIRLDADTVLTPLAPAVVAAMQAAVAQMGCKATFQGAVPAEGCGFLREAASADYRARGVEIPQDDVFVGSGVSADFLRLLGLFAPGTTVALPDPLPPQFARACLLSGHQPVPLCGNRPGEPPLPDGATQADVVFLSAANPAGAAFDREQLARWVDYARERGAVLLYDAAYEAFIRDSALPHSIYEVEGAHGCVVELRSFSLTAGFSGSHCGYTVIPADLACGGAALGSLWRRALDTRPCRVPYIVQRGAAAVFSPAGERQTRANIAAHLRNADFIAGSLREAGVPFQGGENAPFLWVRCPSGVGSPELFERLLSEAGVAVTPGSGFGPGGEGWFRLSVLGDPAAAEVAMKRIIPLLGQPRLGMN